ncbi:MAG: 16S rRNA (adenine(1518)-N(6)/adenine(1519)-N(6))-dimethyltransferase RsmA [Nitrospirae bacterium]|nr:MAG: 16S rRNA (adenine(1518)-N(6)/adenine(1519)-N(6))-dimethyltransferase RsmA [Nitrospirota bacterium]
MTRPGPRASAAPAHVPRRSLGQHFLIDKNIVHKIVRLAELQPGETVLEIGPGRGILTDALLDSSGLVVAVELDAALCAHLRATLRRRSNFRLVEGDALTFDYAQVPSPFLVVANLPYYVSTPLLFRLLEDRRRIDRLVLMLQEEVVARLAAAPGGRDYGALSIAAQFYCEVRQAFRVPPTCFRPKPQVGSAVVVLTPLRKPRVSVADEAFFFRIVRAGFAHRRKALPNSLRDEGFEGGPTAAALEQAGIDPRRRAETLSIEEFAALTDALLSLS